MPKKLFLYSFLLVLVLKFSCIGISVMPSDISIKRLTQISIFSVVNDNSSL